MYKPYAKLVSVFKLIAEKPEGTAEYDFIAVVSKREVHKNATWTTLDIHGIEWRIVLVELSPIKTK